MAKKADIDHGLLLLIVALLAWAIPGAGHFFIKERRRAVILFVTITATFLTGLYIGSIAVVSPAGGLWYPVQVMASPAVAAIPGIQQQIEESVEAERISETGMGEDSKPFEMVSYGKPYDYGQIYTAIAGALNLLCILSAVYMAQSGRGELIGEEENE